MSVSNSDIATTVPFRCKRGDTFTRIITFTDLADLVGYSFRMQVRKTDVVQTLILDFTIGSGLTISGNTLVILKTGEQMKVLHGNHEYDIEVTKPDGTVVTWFQGPFTITNDKSR